MTRCWLIWVVAAALLVGGPALAQSDDGEADAEAKRLFGEARALMDKGEHEAACKLFEQSYDLSHGLGVQYNLAKCLATIGRTATARRHYLEVADVSERTGQPDRAAVARASADELTPRLTRLRIVLQEPVEGQIISLDGKPLTGAPPAEGIPVDPGVHMVHAVAPERQAWETEVTAKDAGVTIDVVVPALAASNGVPDEPPPVETDEGVGTQVVAGIAMGALGIAVLAAAGGTAIAAKMRDGDADAFCEEGGCRPEGLSLSNEARSLGDAATGLLIAGGVLAAAGLVVFLTAPSDEAEAATWMVAPSMGAEGAGLVALGRF